MIEQVGCDAPKKLFFRVAKEMFADGTFNWGRVVALFYFACKLVLKVGVEPPQRPSWFPFSPSDPSLVPAGSLHQGPGAGPDHPALDHGVSPGARAGLDPGPGRMGEAPSPPFLCGPSP